MSPVAAVSNQALVTGRSSRAVASGLAPDNTVAAGPRSYGVFCRQCRILRLPRV